DAHPRPVPYPGVPGRHDRHRRRLHPCRPRLRPPCRRASDQRRDGRARHPRPAGRRVAVAGAVRARTPRGRCRRPHRRRLALRTPRPARPSQSQSCRGDVMWAVTGWAVATWLKITVFLVLGVGAAWLWCSPGWFAVIVIAAALVELWAI